MRPFFFAAALVVLAFTAACGGTSPSSASVTDVSTYRAVVESAQSAATSYHATMMVPSMTMAGCTAVHDAYDAQVRQEIAQLVEKSAAMDAFMNEHHGSDAADLECAAHSMMSELDTHHQRACTFGTLSDDQAEVARHVGAMHDFAARALDRCNEMMEGVDNGAYSWGPMMNGCAHRDGAIVDEHDMCIDPNGGMGSHHDMHF